MRKALFTALTIALMLAKSPELHASDMNQDHADHRIESSLMAPWWFSSGGMLALTHDDNSDGVIDRISFRTVQGRFMGLPKPCRHARDPEDTLVIVIDGVQVKEKPDHQLLLPKQIEKELKGWQPTR